MKIEVKCTYCDLIFEREKSLYNLAIKRKNKQFCSKRCRNKSSSTIINIKCTYCNKFIKITQLKYEKRESKNFFCSHSCSNKNRIGKKYGKKYNCVICNNLTRNKISCSKECRSLYRKKLAKEKREKIKLLGYVAISDSEEYNRRIAKRFLIEEYGHKCWICKNSKWMGKPIPLVIDHIDGNATNYKLNNLRLVCGNCNMLLPTYAGGNKGKGKRSKKPRI